MGVSGEPIPMPTREGLRQTPARLSEGETSFPDFLVPDPPAAIQSWGAQKPASGQNYKQEKKQA